MDKDAEDFLFDLLRTPSPTGFEAPGQRKWAAYTRRFADTVESDAYGNVWATVNGADPDAPTLMIEAHADEIGYIVRHIMDDGFLRIDRIGGSDWAAARGRRLVIFGDRGEVRGVIGNTAIHLRDRRDGEKAPEQHDLYVDIGASSAAEVLEMGIRVGHPAVYVDGPEKFGNNRLVGRALDNRLGGFIIAEVLAALTKGGATRPDATVIALNAVQEEIGGNGAKMAAHRLRPDVCVVLDVTHATDSPGIEHARHGKVSLGGGPSVTHGTVNHPEVVKRLMSVAADLGIGLQHEASSRFTSTDTDSIFDIGDGIPSALVSLPLRYMHSVVEVADFGDVEKIIALLAGLARSVRKGDRFVVEI
ncbi:MAG: M20/M25/M40 family metallo-hydrolase [Verrucomicrobiae bacterium]|nr:M20/M25/M40 family metallo-hydrolase [Verrucomicrobiae bacterium]